MRITTRALVIGAVAALSLTACSSGDGSDNDSGSGGHFPVPGLPTAQAPEPTPEDSPEPTPQKSASTHTASGDYVQPGETYSTSEALVLPVSTSVYDPDTFEKVEDRFRTLTVTYEGIRQGSVDDLAANFSEEDLQSLEGYDVYYLDFTYTLNEQLDDYEYYGLLPTIDAYGSDGRAATGMLLFFSGGPDVCKADQLAVEDNGGGPWCQVALVTSGESVARLTYEGAYTTDVEEAYKTDPVNWEL